MSIFQRNIVGTLLDPSGVGIKGGKIEFALSTGSGTTPDDATSSVYVVGGIASIPVGDDGTVNFNLVPNDKITPSGTVWVATFHFPGNVHIQEFWSVVDDGSPIQIGDVIRSNAGAIAGSQAFLIVGDFADLPTPTASLRGTRGYVTNETLVADVEYVCMKDDLDAYNWVVTASG